ncbi:aryl-sulfate sulfotransferase [Sulfurospirillum halorespirans]|uniref:Arylsulfate sulfotransferase n=1 Tax=Sulfurospirillum halorespirans DSM 13726 TaxID=1193502 RepID=A0A1D7TFP1_9BACT|nr:aryl-sulfate sulfotransferase [Sulfurospirillum halorespirans]AOO63833.1 arylsulfate sulfotransferase [Sulfurospirillum halorespirans DSM 13726]
MKIGKMLSSALVAGLILSVTPSIILAAGGASGPTTYKSVGQIGAVQMDPYGVAPLTALIRSAGFSLTDVTVTVKGKGDSGIPITYQVANTKILQNGGIPVWGLYPDYQNSVEVSYKKSQAGSTPQDVKETYTIYAPPITVYGSGTGQKTTLPKAVVVKPADKSVKDKLYLMNHLVSGLPNSSQVVWNNPVGGALEWDYESYVWIVDTNGDIRWYLNVDKFRDPNDIRKKGNLMGFDQTKDGSLLWGSSQAYYKYDLMGREIFNRQLPNSYIDFSHHMEETAKGHYLMRVASADYKRKDGKDVRTVRDIILETDKEGNVVDEWKLFEILDPYRDNNLLAMDQGAVCLNIDASQAGHTANKEDMEGPNAPWGDVTGVGAGRNWAHVNSVNYDETDDSIIISTRNQSAVVKIGRDKKVKWIIASPEGWNKDLSSKVLVPVDLKGNKIKCESSKCEGTFDWSWTQHTAYKINEKSKPGKVHVSVFDNGDSRGMEQPAMPSMKYSRAVEYVVDEKNMTVQQVWEFGKERGFEWYSPITSVVEYQPKTDSMMVYSATAGLGDLQAFRSGKGSVIPYLHEFKYGTKDELFEMKFVDSKSIGYRALSIDIQSAFK